MRFSFKQFISESTEHKVVQPRPLMPGELRVAKEVQKATIVIHDFLNVRSPSIDEIKKFHQDLLQFRGLKFLDRTRKELADVLATHKKMTDRNDSAMVKELKPHTAQLKAAFFAKDLSAMRTHRDNVKKHLDSANASIDTSPVAARIAKSHFTEEPSFFGTTKLLSTLGSEEFGKIKALDFSKPIYTGFDFPKAKEDDWHYVVAFMTQLNSSPKPKRIKDDSEFRLHVRVAHAGTIDDLLALTNSYLHSNSKELIPQIIKLIDGIPSIKAANDKAKKKHKIVYRGLGFGDDHRESDKSIIATEHKNKFVATSESRHAAKNFALQKGHLESESERRSGEGAIIIYEVTPDAIILDTSVIDVAYGEREIIIDATKASVQEIERV